MPVMSARRRPATRGSVRNGNRNRRPVRRVVFPVPSTPALMPSPSPSSRRPTVPHPPTTVPTPPSADVLGTRVSLVDYDAAMDWMDAMVAARERGYVCVAPVHTVMAAREDPDLEAAVGASSLTVPDGQPLVWALKAFGHELGDRVYGPTLMARYCERSARTGVRMFLYGGRDENALALLTANLATQYP